MIYPVNSNLAIFIVTQYFYRNFGYFSVTSIFTFTGSYRRSYWELPEATGNFPVALCNSSNRCGLWRFRNFPDLGRSSGSSGLGEFFRGCQIWVESTLKSRVELGVAGWSSAVGARSSAKVGRVRIYISQTVELTVEWGVQANQSN